MAKLSYLLTMSGLKVNAWFHALGFHRLPLVGFLWFTAKRSVAKWLSSGKGVPIQVGGQTTYVHPFTIVYSADDWEPYTEELFQNAIKPGSTVLDLGAHHGYFSLLASRMVGQDGIVHAFEPAPENFQILQKNIELNQLTNVKTVKKAVSDSSADAQLFIEKQNDVQGSLYSTQRPGEFTIPVECVTIDDYMSGQPVDVIKMDIEGEEPAALRGMKHTISRNEEIVLFIEF